MAQGQTGGKSLVLTFRDSFFFLFLFFNLLHFWSKEGTSHSTRFRFV